MACRAPLEPVPVEPLDLGAGETVLLPPMGAAAELCGGLLGERHPVAAGLQPGEAGKLDRDHDRRGQIVHGDQGPRWRRVAQRDIPGLAEGGPSRPDPLEEVEVSTCRGRELDLDRVGPVAVHVRLRGARHDQVTRSPAAGRRGIRESRAHDHPVEVRHDRAETRLPRGVDGQRRRLAGRQVSPARALNPARPLPLSGSRRRHRRRTAGSGRGTRAGRPGGSRATGAGSSMSTGPAFPRCPPSSPRGIQAGRPRRSYIHPVRKASSAAPAGFGVSRARSRWPPGCLRASGPRRGPIEALYEAAEHVLGERGRNAAGVSVAQLLGAGLVDVAGQEGHPAAQPHLGRVHGDGGQARDRDAEVGPGRPWAVVEQRRASRWQEVRN